jgi:AraC-like DNA-binding protein
MYLRMHRPGPPLDRFVEHVTYYTGYEPAHAKERLLPDGAVEIIVDLTDTPKRLYDRDDHARARSFRGAWISGMRNGWIVIEAAPGMSMAVIRFRPGGAYPFLGFAVEGITDAVDHLEDVLGRAASSLRDRVLSAPTVDARLAVIDAWLLERSRGRLELHPMIEYVSGRLFAPAGIRVADVVAEVGYSQRQLLATFRKWVGVGPKRYASIRRFQGVLTDVVRRSGAVEGSGAPRREPDWTDVALSHGYYDQAHMLRDFRELAGLTPRAYLAAYQGLENYLPID